MSGRDTRLRAVHYGTLFVLHALSLGFSLDRQNFNATHPAERNALAFLSAPIYAIPSINWIVVALCVLYDATIQREDDSTFVRSWCGCCRRTCCRRRNANFDDAVARIAALNSALTIPISLLFVFIGATELYFSVAGTYTHDNASYMLAVNVVLFLYLTGRRRPVGADAKRKRG